MHLTAHYISIPVRNMPLLLKNPPTYAWLQNMTWYQSILHSAVHCLTANVLCCTVTSCLAAMQYVTESYSGVYDSALLSLWIHTVNVYYLEMVITWFSSMSYNSDHTVNKRCDCQPNCILSMIIWAINWSIAFPLEIKMIKIYADR